MPNEPMQVTLPTILFRRSSCCRSTPVSTIAIVLADPVATCHAAGAPIISRFHCRWKAGSLGFAGVARAGAPTPTVRPRTRSAPQRANFDRTCTFSTIRTPARASGPRLLQAAEDGDDLAVDGDVGGIELDGLEARVRRLQDHLLALAAVGLDRRLLAREAGHDDVALV